MTRLSILHETRYDYDRPVGFGPHRLNKPTRPKWFFERAKYGGILCDIGSHQCEQFLTIAGATNVFDDIAMPSPQVSLEEVARRNPDVILAGPNTARKILANPQWQSVPAVRGVVSITSSSPLTLNSAHHSSGSEK